MITNISNYEPLTKDDYMSKSRTYNSAKNLTITSIAQIFSIIVSFVVRTFFIKLMNVDYLGVNGLFSNVLSILAFSELGLSSAIIYNMYKPVALNDKTKIAALLNFYKRAYRIIALFVLIIGLCLSPFINDLVNDPPNIRENLLIIYILFLINTAASYLYSYSRSLFTAYQKEYTNIIVERLIWTGIYIIQLVYLYYTHDFYGYLLFMIVATIASDLLITFLSKKNFKQITSDNESKLTTKEIKAILKDVYALFTYKVGGIILHSTSNIVIAKIINLTAVGICSNYLLITSSIENILQKALNSIVASIGNLNAQDNIINREKVLYELSLYTNWIYGCCSIMLVVCLNKLIEIWLGQEYLINDTKTLVAIVSSFYIFGSNFAISSFRTTMGLFHQAKYVPLLAAIINLLLSIWLGTIWGLFGIYLSISIARIVTFNSIDPLLVYRRGFNKSSLPYFGYQLGFLFITVINALLCIYASNMIQTDGILGFIFSSLLSFVLCNLIYLIVYSKTASFKSLINRYKNITQKC